MWCEHKFGDTLTLRRVL